MMNNIDRNKLIEDNLKLVPYMISKFFPKFISDEDMHQEGMVSLCKAADSWDGESSKFSTYACNSIRNACLNEIRRRSTKHIDCVSLDSKVNSEEGNSDFYDITGKDDDYDSGMLIKEFEKKLTEKEKQVFHLMLKGNTQKGVSDNLGMSHSNANRLVRIIRSKWRKFNGKS